jgi:hypothetical protein
VAIVELPSHLASKRSERTSPEETSDSLLSPPPLKVPLKVALGVAASAATRLRDTVPRIYVTRWDSIANARYTRFSGVLRRG